MADDPREMISRAQKILPGLDMSPLLPLFGIPPKKPTADEITEKIKILRDAQKMLPHVKNMFCLLGAFDISTHRLGLTVPECEQRIELEIFELICQRDKLDESRSEPKRKRAD